MLEKIIELTADTLGANAAEITAETSFMDDLHADSLDLFELAMALEEEFSVEIPSEDLEKITEAFYMVDKSRSRKEHGAGLGLALSVKIAQLHHTKLSYRSQPDQGTSVILVLQKETDDEEETD